MMALQLGLTEDEVEEARRALGREPNELEWAIIDAEWSEHCSYKSSRHVLKRLPAAGPKVVLGPGYDAGAVDVGGGYVVTLHIESHNHPSAIDPYGGAATGIGGILRDILCMGTRPIALLDSLKFGDIRRSPHSRWLFRHVVRGISDYGNCVGVPTVAGEVEFDECFERNCLVDVVCLGVGRKDRLVLAEARHPGDSVILVGGSTGRDGMRGAAFASKALTERSDEERSAVQIPDPFMKKLIIEATLEAVETGYVRGLKDLGGGGLATALSEMADKGGCGIEVELSRVILREGDMSPIEIMISESQERMIFVVERGREEAICKIFEKYELPHSIVGKVVEGGNLIVTMGGEKLAELPAKVVANAPAILRKSSAPAYIEELKRVERPPLPSDLPAVILRLAGCPSIASKRWVYEQYDHEVGIRTVMKPGHADAAVLRLPNGSLLAVKADSNSKHCYLGPYNGAAGCLAEACRNVTAVGAEPIAFVDHLQFGDPNNPEVFWTFERAVAGLADYARAIGLPCVGGKVSFYNEDEVTGRAIKPSPVIVVIGLLKEADVRAQAFRREGNPVVVVGGTKREMGGSEYYELIHGIRGGSVPRPDPELDRRTMGAVREAIRMGLVESAHDVSKGGLAIALAEMCISGGIGARVNAPSVPSGDLRIDELLFSESHGRFILEAKAGEVERLMSIMEEAGVPCNVVGEVGGSELVIVHEGGRIGVPVSGLAEAWDSAIPTCMAGL